LPAVAVLLVPAPVAPFARPVLRSADVTAGAGPPRRILLQSFQI
jgi:hypothetical protein